MIPGVIIFKFVRSNNIQETAKNGENRECRLVAKADPAKLFPAGSIADIGELAEKK